MDDRRDGGTPDGRGITSGSGFVASKTCASFSSSISLSKDIPQKSIEEHLNLKHALQEATTSPETKAPPIPAIAIQKLSDIVFTIGTFNFGFR
jgi:hypothetical protein